jgi:hypothetical protein
MAIGRTEDRENPWDPVAFEVTSYAWGLIRGFHLGQQSSRLHQQAGHMIASDQIGTTLQKQLANRGPSTHGSRLCATTWLGRDDRWSA